MSIRIASMALVAGLTAAAPTAALAEAGPVAAHVENKTIAPAPAPANDVSGYAEREAQDKKTADFQGGDTVIVMSGAAFVLLLLVLLVI